jgi:histidine ammonia-lyase
MLPPVIIKPGHATLADWRATAEGASVRLDPEAATAVEAGASALAAIIDRGEPVYGINTSFGRLASVRIAAEDLAKLQRNLVLSHAAGVGKPMRPAAADDGAEACKPRPRRLGRSPANS